MCGPYMFGFIPLLNVSAFDGQAKPSGAYIQRPANFDSKVHIVAAHPHTSQLSRSRFNSGKMNTHKNEDDATANRKT